MIYTIHNSIRLMRTPIDIAMFIALQFSNECALIALTIHSIHSQRSSADADVDADAVADANIVCIRISTGLISLGRHLANS